MQTFEITCSANAELQHYLYIGWPKKLHPFIIVIILTSLNQF